MSILNSYLVTSQLLRPFDPLKDYSGRGQWSLLVTTLKMGAEKTPQKRPKIRFLSRSNKKFIIFADSIFT